MTVVQRMMPFVTLNCPIWSAFPQAGIARPAFNWSDMYRSPHTRIGYVTYDNAPPSPERSYAKNADLAGRRWKVWFQWWPSSAPSEDDKRAADMIAKILVGEYAVDGLTVVAPDPPPGSVGPGHYLVLTSGSSNGPAVPLADFQAADSTLSNWQLDPLATEPDLVRYVYKASVPDH
eukprot:jgi/Mesvir1/10848/Mv06317-RA.1